MTGRSLTAKVPGPTDLGATVHEQDVRLASRGHAADDREDAQHDHDGGRSTPGPTARLLAIQAQAGNRAVAGAVQARLEVGGADDPHEVQAEAVADEIVGRHAAPSGGGAAVAAPGPDEEAAGGADGGGASPDFERDLGRARGGGRGLPANLRGRMEASLGVDLGGVRVHEGDAAGDLNRRIQAEAFTVGSDVFLGDSAPSLDGDAGQHLLAHELTHVVQQGGGANRAIRRRGPSPAPAEAPTLAATDDAGGGSVDDASDTSDAGDTSDTSGEGTTYTVLEVAERLIADLEGHEQGLLTDLKPRRVFGRLSKVGSAIDKLKKDADKLAAQADLFARAPGLRAKYDDVVTRYDKLKNLDGWFVSSTPMYKDLRKRKHDIERELATKGRKATRELMGSGAEKAAAAQEQLERTELAIARLQRLMIELQDRTVAFGILLEQHAQAQGHDVAFPLGTDTETQVAWVEQWSKALPDVRQQQKEHLEATKDKLGAVKKVRDTEATYAYHDLSYNKLLKEYSHLAYPGTSRSHSVRVTLSAGAGVELGAFVQISGKVATGDDRGVSPSLIFQIGLEGSVDLGLWKASASVSVSVTMTDSYDSLEHFVANYMKLLSLYNGSVIRYAKLKGELDRIPGDGKEYELARQRMIEEAQGRGFVADGDTVTVGTDSERQLAEMQKKSATESDEVTVELKAGVEASDRNPLADLGPEFTVTASYTRKWYRRLVDYNDYVAANEGVDTELAHLKQIRSDYDELVSRLDGVRAELKSHTGDEDAKAKLQAKESELRKLKNVYEHGHLTFFNPGGRKAFRKQLDRKIASLSKGELERTKDVNGTDVTDLRAVDAGRKKQLTKSENIWKTDLAGAFALGPVSAAMGGTFTRTTNSASAGAGSTGMSWTLTLGADTGIPGVEAGSKAAEKALAEIHRAGIFETGDKDAEPSAGESFKGFIDQLVKIGEIVATVLAGGITITGKLTWKNGAFHTQYVRLLRKRTTEVKGKVSYEGANLAGKYSHEAVDFISESLGTTTLSYVETVYKGLHNRPDGARHWDEYTAKHKQDLWYILLGAIDPKSNVRKELEALPGGTDAAAQLDKGVGAYVANYHAEKDKGGGDPDDLDLVPPRDEGAFASGLSILTACLKKASSAKGSLKRGTLRGSGWEMAEGSLDSRVTQPVDLSSGGLTQKPNVASKSWLTRKVQGDSDSHEDLSRYGNFRNIVEGGAELVLRLDAGAAKPYQVEVKPTKDINGQLQSSAKKLAKWVDLDAHLDPGVWQSKPLARQLREFRLQRRGTAGKQEKKLVSSYRKDKDKLPQASFESLVNLIDSFPVSSS